MSKWERSTQFKANFNKWIVTSSVRLDNLV